MSVDIEKGYGNSAEYGDGNYKGEVGNTYIPDYVSRSRDLIVEQFEDSDKFQKIIESFSRQVQEVEDVLFNLRVLRYLLTAEGSQLDGIGEIVGEPRNGKNDDDYRFAINFRIFINKSFGQMEIISNFLFQSLPEDTVFTIEENYPAAVNVLVQSIDIQTLPTDIFRITDSLAAGGVLINGFIQDISVNGKILRTVEGTSDSSGIFALPPTQDTGTLSEGALGSYPPSEVEAGKLVEHILS